MSKTCREDELATSLVQDIRGAEDIIIQSKKTIKLLKDRIKEEERDIKSYVQGKARDLKALAKLL